MARSATKLVTGLSRASLPTRLPYDTPYPRYAPGMVTRIGGRRRSHLYIEEWMEYRGLSDQDLGNRIGVARQTVYRWRTEQHRLDPGKIAVIASALDCEPQDLWYPPTRPSIDAVTKGLPDDIHGDVLEFARRLAKRAS